MIPDPIAPSEESSADATREDGGRLSDDGGLAPSARRLERAADSAPRSEAPVVALAPGRKLAAAGGGHHVFRFGMRTFLIGSVLFSLQFLAWNLLGIFYGSLVNAALILLAATGTVAWGAIAGAADPKKDRFWDQALVRGMFAFYLMAATALLAGGGKIINDFVQARRVRYVVQERYGFSGVERLGIEGPRTVTLIAVDDVDPAGAFAQAGIFPGQAVVVAEPIEEFYDRLLTPDAESMSVTLVRAPADSPIAPDITRIPTRRATLELQAE